MNFDEYTRTALSTLLDQQEYGDISPQLIDQVLGLVGEGGEVADKVKKLIRDKRGRLSDEDKVSIVKELGDVLWYVTTIAHLLDSSLEDVARANNQKLLSRQSRKVLGGSGDDR